MKDIFFLILLFLVNLHPVMPQTQSASLQEDGTLKIFQHAISLHTEPSRSAGYQIHSGFPRSFPANAAFKNFRNVTLEDLDEDGSDEIIVGIADQLIVLTADSIRWIAPLSGLARFPAAVADLDNDGTKEIVLLTGYDQDAGQIYVFQSDGGLKQGWPVTNNGNWMISSPALADVDRDGDLEIICSDLQDSQGSVYLFHHNGELVMGNWPLSLPDRPAVTPSAGDINGDGNIEIMICTTREIYALDQNGDVLSGWPYANEGTKYSFQSPIIVDIDRDGDLEIAGAGHGDNPIFYFLDHEGRPLMGWPIPVPGGSWTFHTPSLVQIDDFPVIITARPIGEEPADMLYGWHPDGSIHPGFPVVRSGGHEGITTIADVDGDGQAEVLYSSNLLLPGGMGQIHGIELDGSGSPDGFPLLVRGWTFLNGATIGDINGDGMMDLVALSYTEYPGETPDTAFVTAIDLQVPSGPEQIIWPSYKKNNLRNGLISLDEITAFNGKDPDKDLLIYPNPSDGTLQIENKSGKSQLTFKMFNSQGKVISDGRIHPRHIIRLAHTTRAGLYYLAVVDEWNRILQVEKIFYQQ